MMIIWDLLDRLSIDGERTGERGQRVTDVPHMTDHISSLFYLDYFPHYATVAASILAVYDDS